MARRVYSDAERAAALAAITANGGDVTAKLSRDLDIPVGTLRRWASGEVAAAQTADVGRLKKDALETIDAMCERVARYGLAYVLAWHETTPDPDPKLLSAVMTSVGISIDKMRLMREQSTARVTVDDVRKAIEDDGFEFVDVLEEARAIVEHCDD